MAVRFVTALLLLLAAQPAEASRPQLGPADVQPAANDGKVAPLDRTRALFISSKGNICGGTDIRDLLVASKGPEDVRTLPWSQILAVASEYDRTQRLTIQRLEAEAQRITDSIPAAKKLEEPHAITEDEVRMLVNVAVTADGSFGSLETANASECGYKRTPKTGGNKAFNKATAAFKTRAEGLFKDNKIRACAPHVFEYCSKLLPAEVGSGAGGTHGYCTELCHDFADYAKELSDTAVGAFAVTGKTSKQLADQLKAKQAEVDVARSDLNSCSVAKGDLEAFRAVLAGLEKNVKDEHEKLRAANDDVNAEKERLEQLQKDLANKDTAVNVSGSALQGKTGDVQAARDELKDADGGVTSVKAALKESEGQLRDADAKIKNIKDSSLVAKSLKDALSAVVMRMHDYMEAAVRKPLRKLGLGEAVELNTTFPVPTDLVQSSATRKSLQDLRAFCDDPTTKSAFVGLDIKEIPILTLCEFGDVQKVGQEIDGAVDSRIKSVSTDIQHAKNWLNVYHGQDGMDKEKAELLRKDGEPNGLREVIGAFSETSFYKNYLAFWRKQEKYHVLFARLSEALQKAEDEQNKVKVSIAALQVQLAQAEAKKDAATKKLQAAFFATKRAEADKSKTDVELQQLQDALKRSQSRLEELEKAAATAFQRWTSALKALQESHDKGTGLSGLIQLFQRMEKRYVTTAV